MQIYTPSVMLQAHDSDQDLDLEIDGPDIPMQFVNIVLLICILGKFPRGHPYIELFHTKQA